MEKIAEYKLIILYLLYQIDRPLTKLQFAKLTSSLNNFDYFYFQQYLSDLIDSKYVIKYIYDEKEYYKITLLGKESISLTEDMIPGITKLKLDQSIKNNFKNYDNTHAIVAEYYPQSDDKYMINCKITEGDATLLKVELFAGSLGQAKLIIDNWKLNAHTIYPKIIEMLTKNQE